MMEEQKFWALIEKTLKHNTLLDDFAYGDRLSELLEQKSDAELVGFQLQLIELRRRLDWLHVIKAARELEFYACRDVFNRFCNGIIANGKGFYYRIKDRPDYIADLLKTEPIRLKLCYYEEFSHIASTIFYERYNYKKDWDNFFIKQRRVLELETNRPQNIDLDLEK
jgi:hypothetical protein